jgi:hypothetical protein
MTGLITGGMIFGPWISLSMATFQETVPPVLLSQVLAVRGSGRGNCPLPPVPLARPATSVTKRRTVIWRVAAG